jgi:hypothetical protein
MIFHAIISYFVFMDKLFHAIIALLLFRLTMTSSYVMFISVLVLHRSNRKINSELRESVVSYTSDDMAFCPVHENSHLNKRSREERFSPRTM